MAGIIIKPRARILHGHDWVYASEVLKAFGDPGDGDVVSIKDGKDRLLGSAIYNSQSQIVARRFSRKRQELDLDFFRRRIEQAIEYRRKRGVNPGTCRLVWSESDGLPGLIVDRYGGHVVMQTLTAGMARREELIAGALRELLEPKSIIARNDAPVRRAEGLDLATGIWWGEPPGPIEVELMGLRFSIDLLHGHKTGFYLDQLDNYGVVAAHAKGRRVLDCFSNQGAFALACANAGATDVTAVEISADLVELLRANAARNEIAINAIESNVFDFLKAQEQAGAQYDMVILDPPSFTRTKGKLQDAMRGYKEIHLRALKLLAPDGVLATFCCSHHVTAEGFKQTIVEAMVDAKKTLRQIGVFTQAADHPVLAGIPETEYLKGYLFDLVPGR